jgi:hypothetical protein
MTLTARSARLTVLVLSLALAACGGSGGGGGGGRSIKVKGRVPAASPRLAGRFSAALSAADATKVILVGRDNVVVREVVNGAFEVDAEAGQPAGMILVGPGDTFLGYVAVRGVIPVVPLQAADDETIAVDLGTLVAAGTVLTPGSDPIGHGITLTDGEIQALADLGFVTRMILSNPDVDGDTAIDFLQGRQYSPQIHLMRWGTMAGQVGGTDAMRRSWQFGYNVVEEGVSSYPGTATITGPAGSGITALEVPAYYGGYGNALYGIPWQDGAAVPVAGTWTSGYRDRTLTFQVPDLTDLVAAAPMLVPTVNVGVDGLVRSVAWTWRLADGSTTSTPSKLADHVTLQINTSATPPGCADKNMSGSNYSMALPATTLEHTLLCPNVPWNTVTAVQVMYTDIFNDNHTAYFARN